MFFINDFKRIINNDNNSLLIISYILIFVTSKELKETITTETIK